MPDLRSRVATYRWQLAPDSGFDDAASAVPDLAALGVSHLYLSPIAEAVPGSTHGYDVVDPTLVRAELGGEDGFDRLAAVCEQHGLGIVVDIVPNHLAAHPRNPWWWDVLRFGRASRHAEAFDIDWDPPKLQLRDTILLPVLADHYGRELEARRIGIERGGGAGRVLVVRYHDHEFPVAPTATAAVLAAVSRQMGDDVLGVAARVLARSEDEVVDLGARDADIAVAERTALSRLIEPATAAALDDQLAALADDPDRFDAVLEQQHYRLARWQIGPEELVYRRFFDVASLAATRADRRAVFDRLHELPLRLLREGAIDGLRVDHVDGLRDPTAYAARLRQTAGPDAWLLVEKILRRDEALPPWPVDGTTGYEVADLAGGWLTDPAGAATILDAWRTRTGEDRSPDVVAIDARREVLSTALVADLERLTNAFVRVCEGRRRHRDHSRASLRAALLEVAINAPAYRSYLRFEGDDTEHPVATAADAEFVRHAVDAARHADPHLDGELLDLLAAVLLGRLRGPAEAEVALRFQQLTGPVAAKGEEDTALYRWLALPHRCEVGADPGRPVVDASTWHSAALAAQQRWPFRLTTLSTHDTKRAADTRARLAVLTTIPDALVAAFDAWSAVAVALAPGVHPADRWLVFQTLVGSHPMPVERAWPVIEKSLREAKLRSSWTEPDDAYEKEACRLVEATTVDPELGRHVAALAEEVADAGWAAALEQLALQLLTPGVPDVYQGGESWDLSVVDPDNRRGVDPVRRRDAVQRAGATSVADAWRDPGARRRGVPRAALLRTALGVRRRQPAAVGSGDVGAYHPLGAEGSDAGRVLAFARGGPALEDAVVAVVAARPGPGAQIGADANVALPGGSWVDLVTGDQVDDRLDLAGRPLPIAVLER